MNLYLYDTKREHINQELDLGEITADQQRLLEQALYFLNEKQAFYGYQAAILANSYRRTIDTDDEYDESRIEFDYGDVSGDRHAELSS